MPAPVLRRFGPQQVLAHIDRLPDDPFGVLLSLEKLPPTSKEKSQLKEGQELPPPPDPFKVSAINRFSPMHVVRCTRTHLVGVRCPVKFYLRVRTSSIDQSSSITSSLAISSGHFCYRQLVIVVASRTRCLRSLLICYQTLWTNPVCPMVCPTSTRCFWSNNTCGSTGTTPC